MMAQYMQSPVLSATGGAPSRRRHAAAGLIAGIVIALSMPAASAGPLSIFSTSDRFGQGQQQAQPNAAPVIEAQAGGDAQYRIGQLEEQIRALNGRLEELSFQMLQMQEQMRQAQEDNEFRFQALEGGAPAGGQSSGQSGSGTGGASGTGGGDALPGISPDFTDSTAPEDTSGQIGRLIFDEQGQLQDALPGEPGATGANGSGAETASLGGSDPDALYQDAYNLVLAGDYADAEAAFRTYIEAHPDGGRVADASFWLGESQYSQGSYNDAARTFLDAHQSYPNAEKAPEMLLKLGMSLAALDNRDTACATYREVTNRYPDASQTIRAKVETEQRNAGC